jgi:hypothetical protein
MKQKEKGTQEKAPHGERKQKLTKESAHLLLEE